jgi:hypothetical protein
MRLEQSFRNEHLLPQILDLAYGRQTAGLLMLIGRCIKDANHVVSASAAEAYRGAMEEVRRQTIASFSHQDWMNEPSQAFHVAEAVKEILGSFGQKAEEKSSQSENWGRWVANNALRAVTESSADEQLAVDLEPIRERLSEIARRSG